MEDDQVSRAIDEIELALLRDDPVFVGRVRALCRAEIAAVVTTFLLLAGAIVLLAVGVATTSWPAWVAGWVAFVATFGVDAHHRHALRRTPGQNR